MSIERRNFPQFFVTEPTACPYLPGKAERKVFTHLINTGARGLHDTLAQGGFRRSQNIAYRPACDGCAACVSVRVRANAFKPGRNQRRTLKRNADIAGESLAAKATPELYALFRDYVDTRHDGGGMAGMTEVDFNAMINESYVDTRIFEYRLPPDPSQAPSDRQQGTLVAAALSDVLEDGLSMIYSFYDPSQRARGLGTYMILDHLARAKRMGLAYVYLGYWIKNSPKMAYKARFLPQERLSHDGWVLVDDQNLKSES